MYNEGAICNTGVGGIPIPPNITSNGQTDDLLIIFTARPSITTVAIATTYSCFQDTETGRPISAQVNMDPKLFFRGASDAKKRGALLHEIIHALGFSGLLFDKYINSETNQVLSNPTTLVTKYYNHTNGNQLSYNVTYLSTPKIVEAMKSYYNCSSLPTDSTPGVPYVKFLIN